jgi:hypothetical protein
MKPCVKKMIFLLLFFFLNIIIFTLVKQNDNIFILSILHTLFISFLINFICNSCSDSSSNSCTEENYRMLNISPASKCALGPYTWGSPNSEVYKYCSNPANSAAIARESCGRGYIGKPVNFKYTPESNGKWENDRCVCLDGSNTCECSSTKENVGVL